MKYYQYHSLLRFLLGIVYIVSCRGGIRLFYEDNRKFWLTSICIIILTYILINSFVHKIIIDDKGIKMTTLFGLAWQKQLNWDNIEKIHREGYYGFPFFILIPKKGKSMFLAGYKNTNQLLLDIFTKAPHIQLHPDVRRRIEKI